MAIEQETVAWEHVSRVVRERRSNLNVDRERPIPRDLIDRLVELAVWAPNHHRTNPWRFALVTGAGRERLGAAAADALRAGGATEEAQIERARVQFLRAPVVLAVASAHHTDPVLQLENRDAVAAGVQNLLLGATSLGLASAWKTGAAVREDSIRRLLGFGEGDEIVAFVYLGWPTAPGASRPSFTPVVTELAG